MMEYGNNDLLKSYFLKFRAIEYSTLRGSHLRILQYS